MNEALTEAQIEQIALVAHNVNAAYCLATGDTSQTNWSAAPQWQKDSAINGVKFTIANPTATPEQSHENWLAEKEAAGWSYGPVKDVEHKKHPCFMPYARLPAAQQMKDALFQAVVKSMAGIVS